VPSGIYNIFRQCKSEPTWKKAVHRLLIKTAASNTVLYCKVIEIWKLFEPQFPTGLNAESAVSQPIDSSARGLTGLVVPSTGVFEPITCELITIDHNAFALSVLLKGIHSILPADT